MIPFPRFEVSCWFLVLVLWVLVKRSCGTVFLDHLDIGFSGSSIKFVDTNGFFLHSVNNSFALGISSMVASGTSYFLCVMHLTSQEIVWCANRNNPVSLSDLLTFRNDGNVVLSNSSGTRVWSTNTIGLGGVELQMQETGNLVLLDAANKSLWQSFDHPTDTLLSQQILRNGMKLVGSKSNTDISESNYSLVMNSSLVLYALISTPQPYWTMARDGRVKQLSNSVPTYGVLQGGILGLFDDTESLTSELLLDSAGISTLRRATLESDGNLRIYFLSGGIWNLALTAVGDNCQLPDYCGSLGICSNNGQCNCPPSLQPVNSSAVFQGCSPPRLPTCSTNSTLVGFMTIANVNYFANQYTEPQQTSSLDGCVKICLRDCSCTALFFYNTSGSCYVTQSLGSLQFDSDGSHEALFKYLPSKTAVHPGARPKGGSSVAIILIACGTVVVIVVLFVAAWWFYRRKRSSAADHTASEDEIFLQGIPGLPTRFSFKELETATNSFTLKLGTGGFGSVYEGMLPDKSKVAVKRLEGIGQGKKEFWAEVATIGSIHHVHLVRLRGFCAEGTNRLLVYEFMANGSLDRCIFLNSKGGILLDWETRCNILLGTAKGLAYLHEDCRERIIHCDIKPENILLDENFVAKVSDFGLAKLMNREQSEVFTTLRGTRGYLAPEWLMNYAISEKSDVYSFGMVLLEVISGRKNFDPTETSDKWYFPIYAFRQSELGRVKLLVDPKLHGSADEFQVAKITRIALWCIQDEVASRPSMKTIIKMLEGIIDVPNPPSSPQLAVRLHGHKYDGGDDSGISDFNSGDLSASHLSAPR